MYLPNSQYTIFNNSIDIQLVINTVGGPALYFIPTLKGYYTV